MVANNSEKGKPLNCWEFMDCGREPGGANEKKQGVCPAAKERSVDGMNRGKCGGRICWAIAGTICYGEVQGVCAQKKDTCIECKFYQLVEDEEDEDFEVLPNR